MKKMITTIVAAFALIAFAHMGTVYAAGMEKDQTGKGMTQSQTQARAQKNWMGNHEISDLTGKQVKGMNNEDLGKIKDFVTDSRGHLEFALLSTGTISGKTIAVPFRALHWAQDNQSFTLNMSKDQFDKAPEFNKADLGNRQWAQNVYRYFGMQSRWSEQGGKPMHQGQYQGQYHQGTRQMNPQAQPGTYGTQPETQSQTK